MRPEDRNRNILVGAAVIIIIILIAIFLVRRRQASPLITVNSPLPTPNVSFQEDLQNNFGITVPSTASKADLKDASGKNQMGLITLDKTNNQNMYTVIANLDDPQAGYFYEGWLVSGNNYISLGKLNVAKGGWLINYNSPKNIEDHKTVWITLEKVNDNMPETHVLEGSF